MPVSSPSYFPPNRANGSVVGITAGTNTTGSRNFLAMSQAGNKSTVSDLIIIGANAGENSITDANAQYSVLIGTNAGSQFNTFSGSNIGPAIVIGGNSFTEGLTGSSLIAIGCSIFPASTNSSSGSGGNFTGNSVIVGHGIGLNNPAGNYTTNQDVLIGNGIIGNLSDNIYGGSLRNVIIGFGAVGTVITPSPTGFNFNVVIGYAAAQPLKGANNVIIGASACGLYSGPNGNGFGVVAIGQGVDVTNNAVRNVVIIGCQAATGSERQVIIGTDAQCGGSVANDTTLLGDGSLRTFNWGALTGAGCIFLGSNAGYLEPLANANRFIVETYAGGATLNGLLYGVLGAGNLLIGNSVPTGQAGANRDFGGTTSTNVLKILNGTVGNANPIGGGYFYVNAGALHWVGTSGTDTTLAPA